MVRNIFRSNNAETIDRKCRYGNEWMAKTKDRWKRRVRKSEATTATARHLCVHAICQYSFLLLLIINDPSLDVFSLRRFTNLPPFRRMAICSCTSIFHFEPNIFTDSPMQFDMRNGLSAQTTIAEEEPNKLRRNGNKNDLVRDLCEIYSMMWTESRWLCVIVPSLVSSESLHFAQKFLPNSVCLENVEKNEKNIIIYQLKRSEWGAVYEMPMNENRKPFAFANKVRAKSYRSDSERFWLSNFSRWQWNEWWMKSRCKSRFFFSLFSFASSLFILASYFFLFDARNANSPNAKGKEQ